MTEVRDRLDMTQKQLDFLWDCLIESMSELGSGNSSMLLLCHAKAIDMILADIEGYDIDAVEKVLLQIKILFKKNNN